MKFYLDNTSNNKQFNHHLRLKEAVQDFTRRKSKNVIDGLLRGIIRRTRREIK